jgi:hypothetical protein
MLRPGPDLTRVSLVPGYRFRWPHLDTRRGHDWTHRFKTIAADEWYIVQEGIWFEPEYWPKSTVPRRGGKGTPPL